MENLSLQDPPSPQRDASQPPPGSGPLGPAAMPVPSGPPQLPPQMFTTAAQLLDLTDKKLLLVLRDGRKLLGVLRTWDQFANLVLTDTKERYFVTAPVEGDANTLSANTSLSTEGDPSGSVLEPRRLFCDIPRGTYLVRGENVLVLGEVDLDRDDENPPGYEEGEVEEVFRLQKEADLRRKRDDKVKGKKAGEFWGGELEGSGEVLF